MFDSEATIQDVDLEQAAIERRAIQARGCQHAVIGTSFDLSEGWLQCGDCGEVDTPAGFGCGPQGR